MDFVFEERRWDSPYVDFVWRTRSVGEGIFTSLAHTYWEMVVMKHNGKVKCTMRGPETIATSADSSAEAEYFGIMFKPGAYIPHLPLKNLRDRQDLEMPQAAGASFWLKGETWQFPDFENVEVFVDRLARQELLVFDPLVENVLQGRSLDLSLRSVQRRFLRVTGITQSAYYQIERAMHARDLLAQGTSILDTTFRLGYADQPHLTRSMQRFVGQTPGQIVNQSQTV
jgi:AraC-like DNA-binding protein